MGIVMRLLSIVRRSNSATDWGSHGTISYSRAHNTQPPLAITRAYVRGIWRSNVVHAPGHSAITRRLFKQERWK